MMLLRSCNVGEFCTTAAYDLVFMYLVRVAVDGGGGSLLSHYAYMYSLLEHPCDDDVDSKPSCARQRREDVWISFTFPSTWVDTPCNDS